MRAWSSLLLAGFIAAGLALGGWFAARGVGSPAPQSTAAPPAETFARVFEPCAHCHQIGPGARTAMGPQLEGLIGRRAGTLQPYPYSQALRESGIVWTPDLLDRFIAAPQTVVPGTRMMFAGIEDPARRAALVAFIAAPRAN